MCHVTEQKFPQTSFMDSELTESLLNLNSIEHLWGVVEPEIGNHHKKKKKKHRYCMQRQEAYKSTLGTSQAAAH